MNQRQFVNELVALGIKRKHAQECGKAAYRHGWEYEKELDKLVASLAKITAQLHQRAAEELERLTKGRPPCVMGFTTEAAVTIKYRPAKNEVIELPLLLPLSVLVDNDNRVQVNFSDLGGSPATQDKAISRYHA